MRFAFHVFALRMVLPLFLFSFCVSGAPFGDPKAPKGGTFVVGTPSYPSDILQYLAGDEISGGINALVIESLLDQNPETYEFIPALATSWKISHDKKTFTFVLDKEAKFSDGKPVTADDVKFTWDTILNPKNKTALFQSYYSSFESCTVVDPQTVQFKAKNVHFKNLEKLAGLAILPKAFYSTGDFNRAFHTKLQGSGPYTLESVVQGEKIVLKRNPNYWAINKEKNVGLFNFDQIVFRVASDPNVSFEMFKRGDLDYFYFLSAKMWSVDTKAAPFEKNYIKKLKVENESPFGTQGVIWNLRRPLFQDLKIRTAMAYLMNREKWIKDLFYGNYVPAAGPVGVNTIYHSPKNKPIPYDPDKARKLLKEAGWTKAGSDGILVKDALRFEFDLLTDSAGSDKWLTLYQEDLKKVGIKMNIRQVDWATAAKLREDWKFDALEAARGRDIEPSDFNMMWGSKEADEKGSANDSGYKNPEIDKLAAKIDESFDKKKRIPMVRRVDEIIGHDQPMALAWEATYFRIGYWNKFSFPGNGYFKYSSWKSVFYSWWLDKDKEKRLKDAMAKGEAFTN